MLYICVLVISDDFMYSLFCRIDHVLIIIEMSLLQFGDLQLHAFLMTMRMQTLEWEALRYINFKKRIKS
jgi:hypothetical protein